MGDAQAERTRQAGEAADEAAGAGEPGCFPRPMFPTLYQTCSDALAIFP